MIMLLFFADNGPFATGAVQYSQLPIGRDERSSRLLLPVQLEGSLTEAILDTGTPYVICAPQIADAIGLDAASALENVRLSIRGASVNGGLHLLQMRIRADRGSSLALEVTAFVPDPEFGEAWGMLPSFLGLTGCLERFRFAVDPATDTFYFGPLGEHQNSTSEQRP